MPKEIVNLKDHPELFEVAADFFSATWSIEKNLYLASFQQMLTEKSFIPQWYLIMKQDEIIASIGIIDNDFHKRQDLTPNICALYVKPAYRLQGYARELLEHCCNQLKAHGYHDVYLITDHTDLYEHCGFTYYCQVTENSGSCTRLYHKQLTE